MSGNVGTGRVCQLFKLSCKLQSMRSKSFFYMYMQVGRIEKKMSINVVPGLNICISLTEILTQNKANGKMSDGGVWFISIHHCWQGGN